MDTNTARMETMSEAEIEEQFEVQWDTDITKDTNHFG